MEHNLLTILEQDDVHIKIDCERGLAKELSDYFTFKVPNYQFTPAYKNKIWDGQIRLYNLYTQNLYKGLIDYVLTFAKERNYNVVLPRKKHKDTVNRDELTKYIKERLQIPYNPYEHQLNGILHAINNERCLLISPTGSGKSLMIYCLMRFYLDRLPKDKKILIVVPTTGLVSQMLSDFSDYSSSSSWDSEQNCHAIFSGQDKETEKRVVISTWQSLHKLPEEYFEKYNAVFGDECHLFKAKSLTNIMSKLKNCPYRFGTTGTLDDSQTHKLVIEGLFGRIYNVTTTKTLMEKELLSTLQIESLTLSYPKEMVDEIKRATYNEEIKWLIANDLRNDFIVNLAKRTKGNTLLLFNYVKDHGVPLYDRISEECKDKKVFMIHGKTEVEDREEIRKVVNAENDAVLVASYGTCSTGINIKNIHNVIFASPSKSVVRVLQSIGRGLRKSDSKDNVILYDISDDLRFKKYVNHTYRHLQERIKIYNREKFDYSSVVINL